MKHGELVCMWGRRASKALSPQDIIFFCQPRRGCLCKTPLFTRAGLLYGTAQRVLCRSSGRHCCQSPVLAGTTEPCGVLQPMLSTSPPGWPRALGSLALSSDCLHVCCFCLSLSPWSHAASVLISTSLLDYLVFYFLWLLTFKNEVVKIKWVGT